MCLQSELASERAAVQRQLSQLNQVNLSQQEEIKKWREGRMIMLQYEVWYLAILYTDCTLTRLQLSVLYHSQYSHSLQSDVAIHAQSLQISASGTET